MKQSTIVCRIPREAFDTLARESIRQARPLPRILNGAARAFLKLAPAAREEFTIGEPMPAADRSTLGLRDFTARGTRRPNRRKGGAQ